MNISELQVAGPGRKLEKTLMQNYNLLGLNTHTNTNQCYFSNIFIQKEYKICNSMESCDLAMMFEGIL